MIKPLCFYGELAQKMLDEQRQKIASLKPGDVGYGLIFSIPPFDPKNDALIIEQGEWSILHTPEAA